MKTKMSVAWRRKPKTAAMAYGVKMRHQQSGENDEKSMKNGGIETAKRRIARARALSRTLAALAPPRTAFSARRINKHLLLAAPSRALSRTRAVCSYNALLMKQAAK